MRDNSALGSRIPALRLHSVVSRVATWVRPADDACELPLVHRLAIVYLMLPMVIWLAGWFEWWLGIPAALLLAAAVWQALCGSWRPSFTVAAVGVAAAAACWVMLTPAGGVFDIDLPDWTEHQTTLLDLVRYPWPTFLHDPFRVYVPEEVHSFPLLRYYLGYYMTPGLAGHWLGPSVLNWAVPLWTWLGVALILRMFTRERRGWGAAIAVLIFVFFSGMDIMRVILTEGWTWFDPSIEWDGLPGIVVGVDHIEWLGLWDVYMQYTSNMTALMWSPQHFIPAGLYVFLILQLRGHRRFLAVSGVLLAAAPFWSTFVAVGLLPLIAALLWKNGIRTFLRWPNLMLAVPLAALTALYLTSGQTDFPREWIWERYEWSLLARWAPMFYLSEFLLLTALLWVLRPNLRREPFFIACAATLILLPLYHYGLDNTLALRASLPSLLLLCWYCTETISEHGRTKTHTRRGKKYSLGIACMAVILAIGSVTALVDLARATNNDSWLRYDVRYADSGYTTLLLGQQQNRENTAYDIPNTLRLLLDEDDIHPIHERRGELLAQSTFDVYLEENHLVLVKDDCKEDEPRRFFLYTIPANQDDLPVETRALGLDYSEFSRSMRFLRTESRPTSAGTCVVRLPMPQYAVAGFRVGQWAQDGSMGWEASDNFDVQAGPLYRSLTSGEPIIRSHFDVYLSENRLVYVKEPCAWADTEHRFFLHVSPLDDADLPDERRVYGFDGLDFDFGKYGILFDDWCTAVRSLPDYGIAKVATGQFTGEGEVWRDMYAFLSDGDIYRSLTSGEPVIRSQFDVYLTENRLVYVKEPCAWADTEHRFFLHVSPLDDADLPSERREYGFDNLDFDFGSYGFLIDDRCATVRSLPDYDIAKIATGQFTAEGEVWRDVYAFPVGESE